MIRDADRRIIRIRYVLPRQKAAPEAIAALTKIFLAEIERLLCAAASL